MNAAVLWRMAGESGEPPFLEALLAVFRILVDHADPPSNRSSALRQVARDRALDEVVIGRRDLHLTPGIARGLSVCQGRALGALTRASGTFRDVYWHPTDPVILACFCAVGPVLRAWRHHLASLDLSQVHFLPALNCAEPAVIGAWLGKLPWDAMLTEADRRDRAALALVEGRAQVDEATWSIVELHSLPPIEIDPGNRHDPRRTPGLNVRQRMARDRP